MISNPEYDHTTLVPVTAVGATLILLLLRWVALPKPIPGIPYNKKSAMRIFGDAPEMKEAAISRSVRSWMRSQFAMHNSPIVQLFIRPFGKPNVLISDYRESQDILMRRTKEFDRSRRSIEAFSGLVPNSHIAMKSSDPRFRKSKHLVQDLMSSNFLNEVSAPEIHEKVTSLLDLWNFKVCDSHGLSFEASKDLDIISLDIIMAVAFDVAPGDSMLAKQVADWHDNTRARALDTGEKEPVLFPSADIEPEWKACVYLTQSIAVAFRSSFPRFAHWLYLQRPSSRRMKRLKDQLIARNIENGIKRLESQHEIHSHGQKVAKRIKMKCAVDQILLRETIEAKRLGVVPDFHKRAIYDELFLYIVGGHDSISSTLAWWVKYVAHHQRAQSRLRKALYAAHSAALSESRLPTAHEISYTSIPYLNAVIEETLRCSHVAPAVLRQATVDTQILGHFIPKGTDIFLNTSAASFMQPSFDIDEETRSNSARQANDRRAWDPRDVDKFSPERWLKTVESKEDIHSEMFDSHSGPMLAFGVGLRACFGRKVAYLQLQIAITLLVWTFEFVELPHGLNNFEEVDSTSQRPKDCYVKLRNVPRDWR